MLTITHHQAFGRAGSITCLMNTPDSIDSLLLAGLFGIPNSDGLFSLIIFVMYVIFGPGLFLFELASVFRYYVLGSTEAIKPEAIIQWATDPRAMKRGLGLASVITVVPMAWILLTRSP